MFNTDVYSFALILQMSSNNIKNIFIQGAIYQFRVTVQVPITGIERAVVYFPTVKKENVWHMHI